MTALRNHSMRLSCHLSTTFATPSHLFSATKGARVWALISLLLVIAGCDVERRKNNAELGLNPHQIAGRKVYDDYCDRCHEPYSSRGKKGPGLRDVLKRPFLPVSGMP